MASYAPPTQDSAIFNPLFFVSGQEGLTLNEAKKFFLQYPDAQGTENLETTNVDGVLTANDQAFFNDKITLEQTASGEDALNILVDSPGYAIRATTRTNPTTNTQLTIIPSATDGEINNMVKLGDALIYSTTGNLTGGSLAITALGADDDFGVRLNADEDSVEVGGLLELMTDTGIQFYDGTIQNTAYTGDGSETLEEVLTIGNSAGGLTITNLASIAGTTYFIGDAGVNTLLSNGTGGAFDFYGGDGEGLTQLLLKVNESSVSVYNELKLVGANMEFSDGSIQTTAYTGDGTDTLGDVLDNGNIATQDIYMNNKNLTFVNNLQFGQNPGLLMGLNSNTLYVSQLASNPSVNNMVSYDPATGLFTYCPSAYQPGSINIGQNSGQGSAGTLSVHIGAGSGGTSGDGSVGIGVNSGIQGGVQSVALGAGAGFQIGAFCVSVGANAGGYSGGNSIVLNATGQGLNPASTGFFVEPVRDLIPAGTGYNVFYDTGTKEMFYNTTGAGSASLTSVILNYPQTALVSGQYGVGVTQLAQNLTIPSGGRWLIQTQYRIYSATASTSPQQIINTRFTLEGFGGFGSSTSYQDYNLETFTGGLAPQPVSTQYGFTHHTTKIVGSSAGFTMFASVEIIGANLSGGAVGAGEATAIRIGDYP